MKKQMNLKEFMLRQNVLGTFKQFFRLTRHLNKQDKLYTRKWIRQDYDRYKSVTEPVMIVLYRIVLNHYFK